MIDEKIVIDGVEYDANEVFSRRLHVVGVDPTDFEKYQFINVLALHKLSKENAIGSSQTIYRYADLKEMPKFKSLDTPFTIEVVMTTLTKKDGDKIEVILSANFASVKEYDYIVRDRSKSNASSQPKPVAPPTPTATK